MVFEVKNCLGSHRARFVGGERRCAVTPGRRRHRAESTPYGFLGFSSGPLSSISLNSRSGPALQNSLDSVSVSYTTVPFQNADRAPRPHSLSVLRSSGASVAVRPPGTDHWRRE
ncbi:hypothetical protein EVAR_51006_1 [Eumeta japonica]|uniref:Uncharacterized protein n=1 Tax=Eumeta variegata TaxID=151549 RepID=A0A4C1ZSD1_EUMVA|nr:hypothetical protein EVAR_51006_1 [Eumeta japonica]